MPEVIQHLANILLVGAIVKAVLAARRVRATVAYLDEAQSHSRSLTPPHVVIVLCVLREQRQLAEAVRYFQQMDYPEDRRRVLLVTTERERVELDTVHDQTTMELARDLAEQSSNVQWLHCPDATGLKSDQMNFAVEQFSELFPHLDPGETFYAFFDVDSRPAREALRQFAKDCEQHAGCNVFQQSALYLKNFFEFDRKSLLGNLFLKAQALKQTRFILAYEIPRIVRVFNYCSGHRRSLLNHCVFAPCVAHGLYVRVSFLRRMPFPSRYTPEDMFWGFVVSALEEPIVFVRSLDLCETPDSVTQVFKQQASWFKGPFLAFRYSRFVKEAFPNVYQLNRWRINCLAAFGVLDALNWLFTSTLLFVVIAATPMQGPLTWFLLSVFFLAYQSSCWIILARYVDTPRIPAWQQPLLLIAGGAVMLFHSLPAYYSLLRLIAGKEAVNKTERG